jgi:hypothetical protein
MKKMMMIALAACAAGCSVKKIEYEKNENGAISYRIYENDHWLKTESTGIRGGMSQDGRFDFEAAGMKSSPSEEFNRTMQTYTGLFAQLAQIAAATYNPASAGVRVAETASVQQQVAAPAPAASATNVVERVDGTPAK